MSVGKSPTTILIVEDEFLIALDLETAIRELGYGVEVASELERALRLAQQAHIGAALVDIDLGGVKSFGVAVALRERNVPLAVLTGYDKTAMPEDLSAVPILRKPFLRNDLNAMLLRLVGSDTTTS